MRHFIIAVLILIICTISKAQDRITGKKFSTRSEVIAQNGMVATSHPLATQVAIDILKKGGNAIDAAIAANACLGLMEPTGNGIGGDLFAIVWDSKSKKLYGLNASGKSPKSLSLNYFKENGYKKIPAFGPLPISVLGCVDGWFELHEKFGNLSFEDILSPAIEYAQKGFPVTELIGYYLERSSKVFQKYPGFRDTYMPGGKIPQKGEIFKNPNLAKTLGIIARDGRDAFYKGEIANIIANTVQSKGGFLSYDDLASHKSEWIEPVSTNYRGYDVWELPPNGQGIAVLQILNILEGYNLSQIEFGSKEYLHLLIEAKKIAYEDRAKYYSDPNFNKLPIQKLISKEYAIERRKLIKENSTLKSIDAGELNDGDTIYLTVADKDGTMISLIQSNYRGMGSGIIPKGLGFMLQDRGELFSLKEGHFNIYAPGKRPFQTIIPGFITKDGKPFLSFGVMGGGMQPQGHVQIICNIIDFGMNIQEAGDAPRIQHFGSSEPTGTIMTDGGYTAFESGFDYETIRDLIKTGHSIRFDVGGYGGYQAIMWDSENKVYYGASESRKDGMAAGY